MANTIDNEWETISSPSAQEDEWETVNQQPSTLEDVGRSALTGLSELPRAASQLSNKYLRPLIGKEPLSDEQLQGALSQVGAAEYQPQTAAGEAAKLVGQVAPYFLIPGGAQARLGAQTAIGGAQGAITEAAKGGTAQDILKEAGIGAGVTALTGGVLKGAGKAYEAVAPQTAKISGVKPQDVQTILKSEGMPMFEAFLEPAQKLLKKPTKLEKATEALTTAKTELKGSGKYPIEKINTKIDDIIKDFSHGAEMENVRDYLKPQLKDIQQQMAKYGEASGDAIAEFMEPEMLNEIRKANPGLNDSEILEGLGINPETAKDMLDYSNLQALKERVGNMAFKRPETGEQTQANAALKKISNMLKDEIEQISPRLAKANKNWQESKAASNLSKVMPKLKGEGMWGLFRLAGLAGTLIGAPFTPYAASGALVSPAVHGAGLAAYSAGRQFTKPLPLLSVQTEKQARDKR